MARGPHTFEQSEELRGACSASPVSPEQLSERPDTRGSLLRSVHRKPQILRTFWTSARFLIYQIEIVALAGCKILAS